MREKDGHIEDVEGYTYNRKGGSKIDPLMKGTDWYQPATKTTPKGLTDAMASLHNFLAKPEPAWIGKSALQRGIAKSKTGTVLPPSPSTVTPTPIPEEIAQVDFVDQRSGGPPLSLNPAKLNAMMKAVGIHPTPGLKIKIRLRDQSPSGGDQGMTQRLNAEGTEFRVTVSVANKEHFGPQHMYITNNSLLHELRHVTQEQEDPQMGQKYVQQNQTVGYGNNVYEVEARMFGRLAQLTPTEYAAFEQMIAASSMSDSQKASRLAKMNKDSPLGQKLGRSLWALESEQSASALPDMPEPPGAPEEIPKLNIPPLGSKEAGNLYGGGGGTKPQTSGLDASVKALMDKIAAQPTKATEKSPVTGKMVTFDVPTPEDVEAIDEQLSALLVEIGYMGPLPKTYAGKKMALETGQPDLAAEAEQAMESAVPSTSNVLHRPEDISLDSVQKKWAQDLDFAAKQAYSAKIRVQGPDGEVTKFVADHIVGVELQTKPGPGKTKLKEPVLHYKSTSGKDWYVPLKDIVRFEPLGGSPKVASRADGSDPRYNRNVNEIPASDVQEGDYVAEHRVRMPGSYYKPDYKWLVPESGQPEPVVAVQKFFTSGPRVKVTLGNGDSYIWREDEPVRVLR